MREAHLNDCIENLAVVEIVDGLAHEREDAHDLLDDVKAFSFSSSCDGVRDDVERGVEDGSRLLKDEGRSAGAASNRGGGAYASSDGSAVDGRDSPSFEPSKGGIARNHPTCRTRQLGVGEANEKRRTERNVELKWQARNRSVDI